LSSDDVYHITMYLLLLNHMSLLDFSPKGMPHVDKCTDFEKGKKRGNENEKKTLEHQQKMTPCIMMLCLCFESRTTSLPSRYKSQ